MFCIRDKEVNYVLPMRWYAHNIHNHYNNERILDTEAEYSWTYCPRSKSAGSCNKRERFKCSL